MNKRTLKASTTDQLSRVLDAIREIATASIVHDQSVDISIGPAKRTDPQNRRLWAILNEISDQVVWHGRKMDAESWKHVFSAAVQQQEVVPGINGGFVVMGISTRKQSKEWFSDMLMIIDVFCAENGVKLTNNDYRDYPEARG